MDPNKEILKLNCKNRRKTDLKSKFIKVDSPIAKYDSSGNLSCILCRIPIKANIWKVHLNSKQHKQNVEFAKRRTETESNLEIVNPSKSEPISQKTECIPHIEVQIPSNSLDLKAEVQLNQSKVLPKQFFDNEKSSTDKSNRDPEAEWMKFQREIKEADTISNNMVSEEQESLNIKRHLKEIDEQIENWKRFIKINDKKTAFSKINRRKTKSLKFKEQSSSSDEGSETDLLNWRIKSVQK